MYLGEEATLQLLLNPHARKRADACSCIARYAYPSIITPFTGLFCLLQHSARHLFCFEPQRLASPAGSNPFTILPIFVCAVPFIASTCNFDVYRLQWPLHRIIP